MLPSARRLIVLKRHIHLHTRACSDRDNRGCSITVTPSVGMVDEKVRIVLRGLNGKQIVSLVADVTENGRKFESRCVYQADANGTIDNFVDKSIDGTFIGLEPMGLFWSLKCTTGPRKFAKLVKKDVCTPMVFNVKAFAGREIDSKFPDSPLVETRVQRLYKKPSVRRIPMTGRFQGTIFLPEGDGPFPGLIDMFGGIVSLVETRAALLASHGYATIALSYLYRKGLPQMLMSTDFNYIKAWQHGAKILVIVGEDDKEVHPKWHTFFYEQCPPNFKQNIQIHRYPGAGHMIEPPYSPHSRTVTPGRKRMKSINFISEKLYDEAMVAGGWPEQHAFAQEDSWNKILNFLEQNVKDPS